jgi:crossover junction endodeoxyribonuclease RuvC
MKAIGIDPGLAMTGFGVVETMTRGGRACDWGAVRTLSTSPTPARLRTIYLELGALIEKWTPDLVVIEDAFVLSEYPKAAIQLGTVIGVISLLAEEKHLPVLEIKPLEVKGALTGSGRADKEQLKKVVVRLLGLKGEALSSHASDALALALTGLSRKGNLRW